MTDQAVSPGTTTGMCDSLRDGFFMLKLTFKSMPKKSPVKIMYEVFPRSGNELTAPLFDWRYAAVFSEACEKDGGTPQQVISTDESRVYCEKTGLPYWEFIEGYVDVRPLYKGPPLNKEYMALFRAIASVPLLTEEK